MKLPMFTVPLLWRANFDGRFVRETVWDWVGRATFYSILLLSMYALTSLMLPTYAEVLTQAGMPAAPLLVVKGQLSTFFDNTQLLMIAAAPTSYLIIRDLIRVFTPSMPLSARELSTMRLAGRAGWVVECVDDEYLCYGPQGECVPCDHLRDLEELVQDLTHEHTD